MRKRNLDHFFVFSFLVAAHWGQLVIRFDLSTVFVQCSFSDCSVLVQ
ncbi:hypothetical protein SPHINGO8BC_50567 [Sphingobacterium multivorum]|uniref:Uncharacterized protein n=1 Tax=Sphingobacterium multivorum TaxID=28454 RepID=A0A654C1Q6_SPHMU|nr:hypothetical protein SPHINGO8BC_50567 [Sphingobacterium multivorum]